MGGDRTRLGYGNSSGAIDASDAERADPALAETAATGGPATAISGTPSLTVVDPALYMRGAEMARGGMGRIVEAVDVRLGREVALKEMLSSSSHLAARFEREALITARLQHPAIVAVYEAGRWPHGDPFYAMKRVFGRSLETVIRATRTLDERLALIPALLAAFDALAYAHSKRVIHRDLKPANILIGDYGETVVIDWGLAKELRGDEPDAPSNPTPFADGQTVHGAVMGTLSYMPPEQARGDTVDERADVYALGAILYHALAHRPPHVGTSYEALLEDVINETPPALSTVATGVPADLDAIVTKALQRDPRDRYPTAAELAADLRRFQTGQLVGAHVYTRGALLRRWVRRHRSAVVAAGIALVFAFLTLTIAFVRITAARERAVRGESAAKASRDQAILQTARTVVLDDPTRSLATLKTLPGDADAITGRRASVIAAAATSSIVAEAIDASPGAAYYDARFTPRHDIVAFSYIVERSGDRVHIDRWRDGVATPMGFTPELPLTVRMDGSLVVWTDHASHEVWAWPTDQERPVALRAHADSVVLRSDDTIALLVGAQCVAEIAPRSMTTVQCQPPPRWKATYDHKSHELRTVDPDGHEHRATIDIASDDEPHVTFSDDGRAFVMTFSGGLTKPSVTVCSDIDLAHVKVDGEYTLASAFSADGRDVVLIAAGSVKRWKASESRDAATEAWGGGNWTDAAILPATMQAVTTDGHDVAVWDLTHESGFRISHASIEQISKVEIDPDGSRFLTVANDGSVRVWSMAPINGVRQATHRDVLDLRLTADGHTAVMIASGTQVPEEVYVWTPPAAMRTIKTGWSQPDGKDPDLLPSGRVFEATLAPDGTHLAVALAHEMVIMDLTTSVVVTVPLIAQPAHVTFSDDSRRLVVDADTIEVLSVDGTVLAKIPGGGTPTIGAFATSGGELAVVRPARLEIYAGSTLTRTIPLPGTCSVASDVGGSRIAVGCDNGTLHIVPVPGSEPHSYTLGAAAITAIASSQDGQIAIGTSDGSLWVTGRDAAAPRQVGIGKAGAQPMTALEWTSVAGVVESRTANAAALWSIETRDSVPLASARYELGTPWSFEVERGPWWSGMVTARPTPPAAVDKLHRWLEQQTRYVLP